MRSSRKVADVMNRLTVTLPKPRDGKLRETTIPPAVLAARMARAATAGAAAPAAGGAGAGAASTDRAKHASVLSHLAMAGASHLTDRFLAAAKRGMGEADDSAAGGGGGGGAGAEDDLEDLPMAHAGEAPVVRQWLERDREAAGGGPGVHRTDTTRYWDLADPEWKTDLIPEVRRAHAGPPTAAPTHVPPCVARR
jgi:hypothetical protein